MSLTASGWGWRYAGRKAWACRNVDFDIPDGQKVLLLGASGSGKSTLLQGLTGVLGGADEGQEVGQLLVNGRHPSRARGQVGLVLQDPTSQVVMARVGDDVAFGLENLQTPPERIWPLVDDALSRVGLGGLGRDHPTGQLSGGQQQRLAIAGALASFATRSAPAVLCLDEPTANLDPQGVLEVRRTVAELAATQPVTLVIVEHRVDVWADLVDRVIVLGTATDGGGVLFDGPVDQLVATQADRLTSAGIWVPGVALATGIRHADHSGQPILWTQNLNTGYQGTQVVGHGLCVEIPQGASTMLTGPNGAGKSTLALTLAGLLPPLAGKVVAAEALRPERVRRRGDVSVPHDWSSRQLLTRIGTVFQTPEHQFTESSVRAELAVGLKALGWSQPRIIERTDELLTRLRLTSLAEANPFTLSGGEQRRLSVATVLATSPQVIVLDEPTFGQDRNTWLELVELIGELLTEGCSIISVTHDEAYQQLLGDHVIALGETP